METIVVGVDGSEGGQEALRFAAHEAALRGAQLRAVTAWHLPPMVYSSGGPVSLDLSGLEQNAEAVLDRALDELGPETADVQIERAVREGHPAQVLIEEADDASLLVVGSRGHSTLVGLVVGSVSQTCVHHAPCPVVIVPSHANKP